MVDTVTSETLVRGEAPNLKAELYLLYPTCLNSMVLNHRKQNFFSDDRLLVYRPCNSATIWRRSLQVPLVTPSATVPVSGNAIFTDMSIAVVTR